MALLIFADRCETRKRTLVPDGYNNRKVAYADPVTDVRCRYSEKARRGFNSLTGEWMTTTDVKLMVPYNSDLNEGDRVQNIVLQNGDLVTGIFEVEGSIVNRRGRMVRHRSMMLRKVA